MVEYLLSLPEIEPGDTHLHAIRDNQMRITMMILDKLNELTPGLEYAGVTHSPEFPDDTTPLAVAAQHGHFEMIDMLRYRRHFLSKPHPPSCNCEEECKYDDGCDANVFFLFFLNNVRDLLIFDKYYIYFYQ